MRAAVVCLLLVGCVVRPPVDDDPPYDPGGWTNPPDTSNGCRRDSDCYGAVCTRNGQCLPASQVRAVHVTWTVNGQAAAVVTCEASPDLAIKFSDGRPEPLSYAPVPCENGRFTVDKLGTAYTQAALAPRHSSTSPVWTTFDGDGNAAIDVQF